MASGQWCSDPGHLLKAEAQAQLPEEEDGAVLTGGREGDLGAAWGFRPRVPDLEKEVPSSSHQRPRNDPAGTVPTQACSADPGLDHPVCPAQASSARR